MKDITQDMTNKDITTMTMKDITQDMTNTDIKTMTIKDIKQDGYLLGAVDDEIAALVIGALAQLLEIMRFKTVEDAILRL